MTDDPISRVAELRSSGTSCALVTVVGTSGSTPRKSGAKMVVVEDTTNPISGTIGGGKLEALAIENAQAMLRDETAEPSMRNYPLHEADEESFGAVCGGEVILLTEVFPPVRQLVITGAGHCGLAIAQISKLCGFSPVLVDDRESSVLSEIASFPTRLQNLRDLSYFSPTASKSGPAPLAFVAVSRNYQLDLDAIRSIIPFLDEIPYVGMIGSKRKVGRVFADLKSEGIGSEQLSKIHAPIGLDIGSETPGEIAISVLAEILAVTRGRTPDHLSKST